MNAYKRAFLRWGFCKNIPAEVMLYIIRKTRSLAKGSQAEFFWHDKPIDPRKFLRFYKRHPDVGAPSQEQTPIYFDIVLVRPQN